jgi:uncharacterized membrane protein YdbT with pleckstrin-like domain
MTTIPRDEPRDADGREEDLWQGGFSSKAMIGSWLMAGSVTFVSALVVLGMFENGFRAWLAWLIGCGLLWGWLWLVYAYRRITCHYRVTTQRLLHATGLLFRVHDRIEMIDIDDVSFEQGVVERIVGVGNIRVLSSDRSHPELWMYGIARVRDVATLIDDTRRQERRLRGLHIETI